MKNCLIETFKNKKRPPFWMIWTGWMLYNFLMILEGLARLLSLNFWMPNWTMNIVCWSSKQQCNWMIKNKEKK